MKRKHAKTLALIFQHPISGGIKWTEIESLLLALGAELEEGRALVSRCIYLASNVCSIGRIHRLIWIRAR